MIKYSHYLAVLAFLFLNNLSYAQKVAVVEVQKVFDGYQKVKDARERLDKSKKIAMKNSRYFERSLIKS